MDSFTGTRTSRKWMAFFLALSMILQFFMPLGMPMGAATVKAEGSEQELPDRDENDEEETVATRGVTDLRNLLDTDTDVSSGDAEDNEAMPLGQAASGGDVFEYEHGDVGPIKDVKQRMRFTGNTAEDCIRGLTGEIDFTIPDIPTYIDLVVIQDVSGSFKYDIANVKQTLREIVDSMDMGTEGEKNYPKNRFMLVHFGGQERMIQSDYEVTSDFVDNKFSPGEYKVESSSLCIDKSKATKAINRLEVAGGTPTIDGLAEAKKAYLDAVKVDEPYNSVEYTVDENPTEKRRRKTIYLLITDGVANTAKPENLLDTSFFGKFYPPISELRYSNKSYNWRRNQRGRDYIRYLYEDSINHAADYMVYNDVTGEWLYPFNLYYNEKNARIFRYNGVNYFIYYNPYSAEPHLDTEDLRIHQAGYNYRYGWYPVTPYYPFPYTTEDIDLNMSNMKLHGDRLKSEGGLGGGPATLLTGFWENSNEFTSIYSVGPWYFNDYRVSEKNPQTDKWEWVPHVSVRSQVTETLKEMASPRPSGDKFYFQADNNYANFEKALKDAYEEAAQTSNDKVKVELETGYSAIQYEIQKKNADGDYETILGHSETYTSGTKMDIPMLGLKGGDYRIVYQMREDVFQSGNKQPVDVKFYFDDVPHPLSLPDNEAYKIPGNTRKDCGLSVRKSVKSDTDKTNPERATLATQDEYFYFTNTYTIADDIATMTDVQLVDSIDSYVYVDDVEYVIEDKNGSTLNKITLEPQYENRDDPNEPTIVTIDLPEKPFEDQPGNYQVYVGGTIEVTIKGHIHDGVTAEQLDYIAKTLDPKPPIGSGDGFPIGIPNKSAIRYNNYLGDPEERESNRVRVIPPEIGDPEIAKYILPKDSPVSTLNQSDLTLTEKDQVYEYGIQVSFPDDIYGYKK